MTLKEFTQEELDAVYDKLSGGDNVKGWHLHAEYESFPTIVLESPRDKGGDRAWEKHPIQNRWEEITRAPRKSPAA